MTKDYVMPKLAMAMNEGTINEWLVKEGEFVEEGAPIMVVETEKVSYDLESPASGYLHILVEEGETVDCDVPIAQFMASAEECATGEVTPASTEQPSSQPGHAVADNSADTGPAGALANDRTASSQRIIASPLAKKIARDEGLDLTRVAGTGPGERIVKRDVLQALTSQAAPTPPAAAADTPVLPEGQRMPLKGTVRATIAKRMVESLQNSAQLSSLWESDSSRLLKTRKRFVAMEEQLGTRVSVNAFLVRALVCALQRVPIANASIVGEEIVIHDHINVGLAVALPGDTPYDSKLLVPVLKQAQTMGVVEIDRAMKALQAKAHRGELDAGDMSDSTVSFSSTAGLAPPGMHSTPILNLPNAVLLGPATPVKKPVVVKGRIKKRTMLPVSLTFDHRVLDGAPVAQLASHIHQFLENPDLMLA